MNNALARTYRSIDALLLFLDPLRELQLIDSTQFMREAELKRDPAKLKSQYIYSNSIYQSNYLA